MSRQRKPSTHRCACGCLKVVPRKYGRIRKFLNREHYAEALKGPAYAAFRQRRAMSGGRAARHIRHARAVQAAKRFDDKAQAYREGYRTGYNAAARAWERWAIRTRTGAAA